MKILKYLIFSLLSLVIFSCEDEEGFELDDTIRGVNFRMVPDNTSFNILADNPSVTLSIFSENTDIANVDVLLEFTDFSTGETTPRSQLFTISKGEINNAGTSQFTFNLQQFSDAVGVNPEDLSGADFFTLFNIVTMDDGRVFPDTILQGSNFETVNITPNIINSGSTTSFTSNLQFPISCPSDLPTEPVYNVTTTVDATCCGLPTGTFTGNTATITKVGNTSYQISDFLNFYFAPFTGGNSDEPVVVNDVCNIISVNSTNCPSTSFLCYVPNTTDQFGSFDPATNTWTIKWEDAFGNGIRGTTVLTPQ